MTSTTVVIVEGGIVTKREGPGSWTSGVGGWCHFRCLFDDVLLGVVLNERQSVERLVNALLMEL